MAVIDSKKRHDLIFDEALLAWKWLIRQPAYKADFERQRKLGKSIDLRVEKELKKKYGFYPLVNPELKWVKHVFSDNFFCGFGNLVDHYPYIMGATFPNINPLRIFSSEKEIAERKKFCSKEYLEEYDIPPSPIIIEVSPYVPINFILPEIRSMLAKIKKAYNIKDKKPRLANLNLIYQYYVLENLGVRRKEIRREIAPFTDRRGDNESQRKKAYRISKKAKAIRTQKL